MQSDNSINCKAGSGQPFAPPAAAVLHRSFSDMRQIGFNKPNRGGILHV